MRSWGAGRLVAGNGELGEAGSWERLGASCWWELLGSGELGVVGEPARAGFKVSGQGHGVPEF